MVGKKRIDPLWGDGCQAVDYEPAICETPNDSRSGRRALFNFHVFQRVQRQNSLLSYVDYLLVSPPDPSVRAGLAVSLGMTVAVAAELVGLDAEDEKRLFAAHFSSSFTADHGKS